MSLSSSLTTSRPRRLAALTGLLTGVGASALALAPPASASTIGAVYTYTGAQQTFVVPAGVTSVHVVAVGGRGGDAPDVSGTGTHAGGSGAVVTADLDVTGGQHLYLLVGGNGQDGVAQTHAAGGFNGGGTGGLGVDGGGGGGGASDVRTVSSSTSGSLESRLLVAGGGGGAADSGAGGSSAENGSSGESSSCAESSPGGGGQDSGGAGGTNTHGSLPDGQDGDRGTGGDGGTLSSQDYGGGAGGGGLYGGGGGAGGVWCAAGGGGGSSYGPQDADFGTDSSGTPSISISYVERTPQATTTPATDIDTQGHATLTGVVNPEGLATIYHFEFGPASAGDTDTASDPVPVGSGTQQSEARLTLSGLTPATTYIFRIVAQSDAGTTDGGLRSFTTPGGPPQVTANPASNIGQTSATLNGVVNPEGLGTAWQFQYWTGTNPSSSTTGGSVGGAFVQSPAQETVTGLAPGTTYHFRLVASNLAGPAADVDRTFTTLAASPPTATTSPATRIGQHGATLNGSVNPRGSATTYYFQYGKTTSYGLRTATRSAGSGTTAASVAATLSGLPRHTAYHFRLVAVNATGTVHGVDRTFRTT